MRIHHQTRGKQVLKRRFYFNYFTRYSVTDNHGSQEFIQTFSLRPSDGQPNLACNHLFLSRRKKKSSNWRLVTILGCGKDNDYEDDYEDDNGFIDDITFRLKCVILQ